MQIYIEEVSTQSNITDLQKLSQNIDNFIKQINNYKVLATSENKNFIRQITFENSAINNEAKLVHKVKEKFINELSSEIIVLENVIKKFANDPRYKLLINKELKNKVDRLQYLKEQMVKAQTKQGIEKFAEEIKRQLNVKILLDNIKGHDKAQEKGLYCYLMLRLYTKALFTTLQSVVPSGEASLGKEVFSQITNDFYSISFRDESIHTKEIYYNFKTHNIQVIFNKIKGKTTEDILFNYQGLPNNYTQVLCNTICKFAQEIRNSGLLINDQLRELLDYDNGKL